jgi:hypothetical protein
MQTRHPDHWRLSAAKEQIMNGKNLKYFVMGAAIVAAGLGAFAITLPAAFTSGEVLSAAKLNSYFTALNTGKQERVTGTCAVGSSIREIAENGAVTCQADNGGTGGVTYSAGAGLRLNGSTFSIDSGSVLNFEFSSSTGMVVNNTSTAVSAFSFAASSSSQSGSAITGVSSGTSGNGVLGRNLATGGIGVRGEGGAVGVRARTSTGVALEASADNSAGKAATFTGTVEVDGQITKRFSATSNTYSQATPIAYGTVEDGVLTANTPNVTATKVQDGLYTVTVVGYDLVSTRTVAVATSNAGVPRFVTARVNSSTDSVTFNVYDVTGNLATSNNFFYFVIYSL